MNKPDLIKSAGKHLMGQVDKSTKGQKAAITNKSFSYFTKKEKWLLIKKTEKGKGKLSAQAMEVCL